MLCTRLAADASWSTADQSDTLALSRARPSQPMPARGRRSVRGSGTMFGVACVSHCTKPGLSETKRNAYSFLHCLCEHYSITKQYILFCFACQRLFFAREKRSAHRALRKKRRPMPDHGGSAGARGRVPPRSAQRDPRAYDGLARGKCVTFAQGERPKEGLVEAASA